ncbi:MAG: TolC family outer membrane protein [Paracoccaceae bacterium]
MHGCNPGRIVLTGAILGVLLGAGGARADSLTDALISAYQTNPLLAVSRASLRAVDEGVGQARSGLRPNVTAGGSGTLSSTSQTSGITDSYRASLDAELTLFDGGQTKAAVAAAIADVEAGRASLRDAEQTVLLDATTAFMNVRRDLDFVSLAKSNVNVITQQVRAAQDRFEVGEVTRTDVSQAKARLAAAQSNLSATEGALARSRQNYLAVVGKPARKLQAPPALPKLPRTLEEAQAIAMREHPALGAARARLEAAKHDVERAKAALRLNLSLSGSLAYSLNTPIDGQDRTSATVTLGGSVPLYTGGNLSSLVRRAQQILEQRKHKVQDTARLVAQSVAFAWADLRVARASIRARKQQIEAARVAFEGVGEEARLGARTTLDVLDAEQELLNARTDLVAAKRDEYVAAFNLLSAMGLLSVKHLGLGIPVYDPTVYFEQVQSGPSGGIDTSVVDRIRSRWGN